MLPPKGVSSWMSCCTSVHADVADGRCWCPSALSRVKQPYAMLPYACLSLSVWAQVVPDARPDMKHCFDRIKAAYFRRRAPPNFRSVSYGDMRSKQPLWQPLQLRASSYAGAVSHPALALSRCHCIQPILTKWPSADSYLTGDEAARHMLYAQVSHKAALYATSGPVHTAAPGRRGLARTRSAMPQHGQFAQAAVAAHASGRRTRPPCGKPQLRPAACRCRPQHKWTPYAGPRAVGLDKQ